MADPELTVTRGTYVHRGETFPDTWLSLAELPVDDGATIGLVVDHTHARGFFPWQSRWWREGEFLIPLRADLDAPTWGLVMTELFAHLSDDEDDTPAAILRRALTKRPWHLYPGVQVEASDGRRIVAGCCASVADWRRLTAVLTGADVELGHDPNVTVRREGDVVAFRSAMPISPGVGELVSEPEYIAMPAGYFAAEAAALAGVVTALVERVESWAWSLTGDADLGRQVADAFAEDFSATVTPAS